METGRTGAERAAAQPSVVSHNRTMNTTPPTKPKRVPYQPKTGQRCSCKPGIYRDNCPACEGTGWVIDFAAIRARQTTCREP